MSTTIVMSSVAAASAAQASAAASRARFESCKMTITQFDSKTATVEQMREYSSCVENNLPAPLDSGFTLMIKIFIVLGLVGLLGGFVAAYRDRWSGIEGYILLPIVGAILVPGVAFIFMMIAVAITFLFKG